MALFPTWSRRKKAQSGVGVDPFFYDHIPANLRVQLIQIMGEISNKIGYRGFDLCDFVVAFLRKEFGRFQLVERYYQAPGDELENWLLFEKDIDRLIDGVEYFLIWVERFAGDDDELSEFVAPRIAELNARMMEAGFGYQFENSHIIQMSDEFNHKEVILPALNLLAEPRFATAQKEFLEAHSAFRARDYEKTLIECAKALEGVLKILAKKRKWGTKETDTASTLIAAAFSNNFVPPYMQSQFTALRSLLESGVPTLRNKSAAHTAAPTPRQVPAPLAQFQLNQTAAVIRFLVDLDK